MDPLVILVSIVAAIFILMAFRAWGYKRRKEADRAYQQAMRPGDKVILSSGIHGTIVALDKVTARVEVAPGVELTVERFALATLERDLGGA